MAVYDIAIIGAGPAGLSAGITARARNKNTIIISNKLQDNPLAKSKLVDNYPGMPGVSGLELLTAMAEHADSLGCEFMQARVITILPLEVAGTTSFFITTSGEVVEARTVIIALGSSAGGKPIEGELEFLGRGVSYCATCDGMLFRNSDVCVVGLSSEAFEEAEFLAEIGANVHYLAASKKDRALLAADDKDADTKLPDNLVVRKATACAIEGDALGVTGVRVKEALAVDNNAGNAGAVGEVGNSHPSNNDTVETIIPCQGVFVLRSSVAPTLLLATLELEGSFIKVDARMRTNVAGVFAAGDCTGKPLQVAKAVGEGQIACFSAVEHLDTLKQ